MASMNQSCPYGICDGSGWLPNPANPSGEPLRCRCRVEALPVRARDKAELFEKYYTATFETYRQIPGLPWNQTHAEALAAAQAYAENWPEMRRRGQCLAVLGPPSSGKSHLASAVCTHLIINHWTKSVSDQDVCLFLNVAQWFGRWTKFEEEYSWIKSAPRERQEELRTESFENDKADLIRRDQRMLETELLVIDDLTLWNVRSKKLDHLTAVIEERTHQGLPILVTDNITSWKEIAEKLGEVGPRVVHRLARNGQTAIIKVPTVARGR